MPEPMLGAGAWAWATAMVVPKHSHTQPQPQPHTALVVPKHSPDCAKTQPEHLVPELPPYLGKYPTPRPINVALKALPLSFTTGGPTAHTPHSPALSLDALY